MQQLSSDLSAVWTPLPGTSQEIALDTRCQHTLYCGSRGPGKSDTQLMRFRRRVGIGYGTFWRGIILDREFKNLDDLVQKSKRWFSEFNDGAVFLTATNSYKWVWPTGEELLFRTAKHDEDYWAYHGQEFCVAVGTLVKTPTGYTAIEKLKVGDAVVTPGGVDYVTRTFSPKVKSCVTASFYDGSQRLVARQVQSVNHRLLTNEQKLGRLSSSSCRSDGQALPPILSWRSYKHLDETRQENQPCDEGQKDASSSTKDAFLKRQGDSPRPASSESEYSQREQHPRSNAFGQRLATQFRSLCKYVEPLQGLLAGLLRGLSYRLRPHVQAESALDCRVSDVNSGVLNLRQKAPSSLSGYPTEYGFCGGQLQQAAGNGQETAPLHTDAVIHVQAGLLLDDCATVHVNSRCHPGSHFANPYERQSQVPADQIGFVDCELVPCGDFLTVDITVGTNKLYITEGGVVNSNCFIGWNELTKYPTAKLYNMFMSCNRSSWTQEKNSKLIEGADGVYESKDLNYELPPIPLEVFSTTNPWGAGHAWVKAEFIDPAPYGVVVRKSFRVFDPGTREEIDIVRTQVAVFGSYKENKYLSPQYVATLMAEKDPNLRKAWLQGSWDVAVGGAFSDLWRPSVHIKPRFKIPAGWRLDRTFDWGSTHPFWVGWWAETNGEEVKIKHPDGTTERFCPPAKSIVLLHELYGTKQLGTNEGLRWSAPKITDKIIEIEKELKAEGWISTKVMAGPADNQISNKMQSDEETIEKKMASKGVKWTRSDKSGGSRVNGFQLFRDRLEAAVENNGPAIYTMVHNRASIAIIPMLPRDEMKPDDVDTDSEDHPWDGWRYRILAPARRAATALRVGFAKSK